MSKKGLLIAAVLIFALVATAMALENKNANDNFTSQEYLNAKSIESIPDAANAGDLDADFEEYSLRTGPDRWTSMFSTLQPSSGNGI
ncbi:hypothetical protein MmiAt1_02870 [Methanimicrococcus sp. At1]|uniref:Uncharacterized protein n=1 Tax=Methanimicrococcus hacksteinii TaxID=3028293 RepID=A0ABU3VMW7_9EURY|nr:hypothetical protein [Methanimicrococcus sp. At1]MDV0444750.1 hypothetical protein [Methanimicrococcus sp. At1]